MPPATDAVRYDVSHLTAYRYYAPVSDCVLSLHLHPRQGPGQKVETSWIGADPPGSITAGQDGFGNPWHLLAIHSPHEELRVIARSTVKVTARNGADGPGSACSWGDYRALAPDPDHWNFLGESAFARSSPALADFARRAGLASPEADPQSDLAGLSTAIHREFEFAPGSTTAGSPIEHVLETGRGVCQDYAHVMTALARGWGVPTRYVSGYLYIADYAGLPIRQSAMHAWVECLLPDGHWLGFDPANDRLAVDGYVRVAIGRDYGDVSPIAGVYQGGRESELSVEIDVVPAAHRGDPDS